jgi:hypothetical protein
MRLISFDIGIKNLAYCIVEIQNEQSMEIVDWNVVNLISPHTAETEIHTCNCIKPMPVKKPKKGEPKLDVLSAPPPPPVCGKTAKYRKGETQWFCETHAKSNTQYLIPKKEHLPVSLKKRKVPDLVSLYMATHPLVAPERIAGMKKQDIVDAMDVYYRERCLEPIVSVKHSANDVDLIQIGRSLQAQMDRMVEVGEITHVIIENQISTIATRMKTLQGMLTQWFISKPNSERMVIEYISSANKLKGFAEPSVPTTCSEPGSEIPKKKAGAGASVHNPNYKQHKKDSVSICSGFLENNETLGKWKSLFQQTKKDKKKMVGKETTVGVGAISEILPTHTNLEGFLSKKDDLADCFLQGIWYLRKNNIITCAENLKINNVYLS